MVEFEDGEYLLKGHVDGLECMVIVLFGSAVAVI